MGAAILECKPYIVLTISAIIISGKIFLGMYINVHKYVYINYHLWKIYGKFGAAPLPPSWIYSLPTHYCSTLP